MNSIIISVENFFGNPVAVIIAALILICYSLLSRKVKMLPRIPLFLFILYLFLKLFDVTVLLGFDKDEFKWLNYTTTLVLYFAIIRLCFAIIVERTFRWKQGVPLPKITRDFFLIVACSITALVLLRTKADVNLAGIITTSAVLTASIGLAAQSTLSNLFSGLTIQIDRPFSVGDWVEFAGYTGQVIGIGWKSTRIKTFEDELVVVPNADITKTTIKNFSRPTYRHIATITVGVDYAASPSVVRDAMLEACKSEPDILSDPTPEVRLKEYADSTIVYLLRFAYNGFEKNARLKAKLLERIWYSLKRHGVKIPYPVRDIIISHVERKYEEKKLHDMKKKAFDEIDKIALFAPLSLHEKEVLSEKVNVEKYGAGEFIVRQGDSGESAFVIFDGLCDVVLKQGEKESCVATLGAHSMFGEMSLLTGAPRTATVVASRDMTVFKIDKATFKDVIISNPSISDALADILASRETALQEARGTGDAESSKSNMLNRIKKFFGVG